MKRAIISAPLLLWGFGLHAQTRTVGNSSLWLTLQGEPNIYRRWHGWLDMGVRRSDGLQSDQQQFIRPGLGWRGQNGWRLIAGYAFFRNFPYGPFPSAQATPEHRTWFQLHKQSGRFGLLWNHRLFVEGRWPRRFVSHDGETVRDGFSYIQRVRYRIQAIRPLYQPEGARVRIELRVGLESFAEWSAATEGVQFPQHRLTTLMAVRRQNMPLEWSVGYMLQTIERPLQNGREANHTLVLTMRLGQG